MFNNWIIYIYIYIIILSEKNWELVSLIRGEMNSFVNVELLDLSNGRGELGTYIKGDKCWLVNENKICLIKEKTINLSKVR